MTRLAKCMKNDGIEDEILDHNYEYKHSALQYVTPMEKLKGKHIGIFENINSVLEKAKLNHPERWGSKNTKRYEVRKVEVLNPDEPKSA